MLQSLILALGQSSTHVSYVRKLYGGTLLEYVVTVVTGGTTKDVWVCQKEFIGGFRNSQSDVIFAHAHIRGRQRYRPALWNLC